MIIKVKMTNWNESRFVFQRVEYFTIMPTVYSLNFDADDVNVLYNTLWYCRIKPSSYYMLWVYLKLVYLSPPSAALTAFTERYKIRTIIISIAVLIWIRWKVNIFMRFICFNYYRYNYPLEQFNMANNVFSIGHHFKFWKG